MIFEENLKQLYYFYIVAKNESFSDAAKKIFISQPAISMQIRNLEKNLGISLIKRGSKFSLTEQGELLFNDLSEIFQSICNTEQKLLAYSLKDLKKITIGMSEAYSRHFIIDIFNRFKDKFPEVGLKFFTENSIHLLEKILSDEIDIAVIGDINNKIEEKNFIVEHVKKEEIVLVSAPKNKISNKKEVTIKDVLKEKIILKDENSATRNFIQKLFPEINEHIFTECESTEVLKKLVIQNNGITFLTRTNVIDDLKNSKLKKIKFHKKLFMPIKIIYRKEFRQFSSGIFLIKVIKSLLQ